MLFSAELSWILTVLLVSVRLGTVLLLTPVFNLVGLPLRVRIVLVLALSALLVSAMSPALQTATPTSTGDWVLAAMSELALGGLLAFTLFATFAAFQFAGRLLDIQLGFGVAGLIDPSTRVQAPLLGTLLNMTAVVIFFLLGGHRLLLQGLAFSLTQIPPGSSIGMLPINTVIAQFGALFVYAVLLAMPVMTVVLLIDIALAIMSRTMPQMNVFVVGLPLKILVGLIALAVSLQFLRPVFERVYGALFENWQSIMAR